MNYYLMKIVHEALKAVPAIRYALGLAGIGAAVAIVAGFQLDFRVAIFGTIIMIALMFVLLVFAKLVAIAKAKNVREDIFVNPALVATWAFLILTIVSSALLMTSYFFVWPITIKNYLPLNNSNNKSIKTANNNDVEKKNKNTLESKQFVQNKKIKIISPMYGEEININKGEKISIKGRAFRKDIDCESMIVRISDSNNVTSDSVPLFSRKKEEKFFSFKSYLETKQLSIGKHHLKVTVIPKSNDKMLFEPVNHIFAVIVQ
ncbi:MAG: hypothetical protein GY928_32460 [Colwellia sp.]|nr:hypothetical protein [Colwellia sp.]